MLGLSLMCLILDANDSIHSLYARYIAFHFLLPNSIFSTKSNPMQFASLNQVTFASYTVCLMSTSTHVVFLKTYILHRITHEPLTLTCCNGGPSPIPWPKVLPDGRPILHSHNYTLTINKNYWTDYYCARFPYYYKN